MVAKRPSAGLSPEQLEMRRSGIGSSEIAAIVGLSPWQSAFDVFNRKIGLTRPGIGSDAQRAGQWLEDSIGRWAAHRMKWNLRRCNRTLRHRKHSWILATPDRFIVENRKRKANCEIKTTGRDDDWGAEGTAEVPDYYLVQGQWQMGVAGLRETFYPVFFFGSRQLRIYRVKHSSELMEALIEAGHEFWHEHVQRREPPPIDGSDGCSSYLAAAYKSIEEIVIPAPRESLSWAEQLARAKAAIRREEQLAAEAENHLRALVGPAKGIECEEFRYTYALAKSGGVDYKALCHELLAILQWGDIVTPERARAIVQSHARPGTRRGRFTPRTIYAAG